LRDRPLPGKCQKCIGAERPAGLPYRD
jgi:hypothetical protein